MNRVLRQWLLNLAIDFPVHFGLLPSLLDGNDREPQSLNVKALRGFELDEGVAGLMELAESGLIEFFHQPGPGEARAISTSEVLVLRRRSGVEKELSFQLTDAGGRAWESAAEPHWRRMQGGFATPREENGRLIGWDWTLFSQDREHLMATIGWWPVLNHGEQIDLRSITWEFAEAYLVKYWKRLPNMHLVNFESGLGAPSMPGWNPGNTPEWFTAWSIARSTWYRQPWEMEGWSPKP